MYSVVNNPFIKAVIQASHKKVGPGYQYQDTQESVPAYFQTEHKEINFKCNFLPSYSPKGAPLLQNLMRPQVIII